MTKDERKAYDAKRRKNNKETFKWLGRRHATKQVEAYAVIEQGDWLVITVVVKFF